MSKIDKSISYTLEVYDNEIPVDLQNRVSDFLLDSEYCVTFYDPPHSTWHPRTDTFVTERKLPSQPRLPIAWDEASLAHRAPAVDELWTTINDILDNQFEIAGIPEGMSYMTGISPLTTITKADGSPGTPNAGWRVYGSGNERELRARTKSIHRDNPYLDQDQYYNLVYFANPEWHPQFYGETLFHSNDATTGDYTGRFDSDQPRNFPIGEVENVVAPKPGRFMLFDARYMHQVKPSAVWAMPIMGVVFRLQKKS